MATNSLRATGRILLLHQGRILLMERHRKGQHYFSVPGGGVELGETPAEAAEREITEETGVIAKVIREIYRIELPDTTHHMFLGEYISGEPQLQPDSPEAQKHGPNNHYRPLWVPIDDVKKLPIAYWDILKPRLVRDLEHGFTAKTVTLRATS
jgi:8-oxo-dGTP diphosphatase